MTDLTASFQKLSLADIDKIDDSQYPTLSNEELALKSQFVTLSARFPDTLTALNDSLRSTTYIVGDKPSSADVIVFSRVAPLISGLNVAEFRHILRWADLVQNTLVDVPEKLSIDLDASVQREIKAKPEKKKAEPKKEEPKKEEEPAKPQSRGKPSEADIAAARLAKEAKKAAKAKQQKGQDQKPEQVAPSPSMVDFRVGFIQKAVKHPDADALYVSTIDMGDEDGPRTVCSGLVKYVPIEEMQQRYVIVIANLKPVSMRGVKSCAMVLCASDEEHGKVEFVNPPEGSKAGDKIFFEGFDGEPPKQLNPKKKIFEAVQPSFGTNDNFEVVYKQEGKPDAKLVNKDGKVCKNSTIVNACVR